MDVALLIAAATGCFVFFGSVLLLFGLPACQLLATDRTPAALYPSVALGLGSMSAALTLTAGVWFGLSNLQLQLVLGSILACSAGFTLTKGWYRRFSPANLFSAVLVFLYYLICLTAVALPSGSLSDVSAARIMELTGLPIDSLIPYNVGRTIIARISPRGLEVVPDWFFSERGPLAGIVVAAFAILTGTEDRGPWLSPSAGTFFVYEALLVFLNLCGVYAAVASAEYYAGRRSALFGFFLIISSYSVFQNIIFAWPKFFMAYFVLTATLLMLHNLFLLAGIFGALALLAHDAAIFSVVVAAAGFFMFPLAFGKTGRSTRLKSLGAWLLGFAPLCLLWWSFRAVYAPASGRLLYLHLFCFKDAAVEGLTFGRALRRYFQEHTVADIALTRLQNLLYPFDVSTGFPAFAEHSGDPAALVRSLSFLVPYQFIYGMGIPTCLLVLAGLCCLRNDSRACSLRVLLWVGLGTLLPAALITACPLATWNHTWSYVAMLSGGIFAGYAAVHLGIGGYCGFLVAVASNLFILVNLHYGSGRSPALSGISASVYWGQLCLFMLLAAISGWIWIRSDQKG